jgi:hypothetical protein
MLALRVYGPCAPSSPVWPHHGQPSRASWVHGGPHGTAKPPRAASALWPGPRSLHAKIKPAAEPLPIFAKVEDPFAGQFGRRERTPDGQIRACKNSKPWSVSRSKAALDRLVNIPHWTLHDLRGHADDPRGRVAPRRPTTTKRPWCSSARCCARYTTSVMSSRPSLSPVAWWMRREEHSPRLGCLPDGALPGPL